MSRYTNLQNLSDAISRELKNYSENVTENIKNAVDDVTKTLVRNTKNDAKVGRRNGKYKKSISSKTVVNKKYEKKNVWYVKDPEYRLAHLLNNGHKTKNGGHVNGDNHITKNEEIAIQDFERKVRDAIENGH